MDVIAPTRPVVVCGMPRSGTSLAGQIVKKADGVVIFPEFSPAAVPAMFDTLAQTRDMLSSAPWHGFPAELVDARIVELLRRMWAAGRPAERAEDPEAPVFGLKQPNAELYHERFAVELGRYRPRYVYTVRDPAAMYDSLLRMAAWGDLTPRAFRLRLELSFDAAAELAASGDGFVLNVARATADVEYRERRCTELMAFLDLEPAARFANFLRAWPPVNRAEGENRGDLADREIVARVETFRGHRRSASLLQRAEGLGAD
jgi:hypothetical protein